MPRKKLGPRLACLAGTRGTKQRGRRVATPYCSVLSLVRSHQKVADRIPGKWPQAHSPAIGGGAYKDEQWISTKMLRTAYDPCSLPYSVPFWDSFGSCETYSIGPH